MSLFAANPMKWLAKFARGLTAALLCVLPVSAHALEVAFHYGEDAPLDALRTFDVIVVEPGHTFFPREHLANNAGQSALYAYVSIGEVHSKRSYRSQMPAAMLAGENEVWKSDVVNQAHPDWPQFFVNNVITPLWEQGYTGFFLDTMDSYQTIGRDSKTVRAQQDGLVKTIEALRAKYPNAKLISNRGFELLPRIAKHLQAVAAESLIGRWSQAEQRYVDVPAADRRWLLDRFAEVKQQGLQAISIDYADPTDRTRTRAVAQQVAGLGVTPYVTDGALKSVGIGRFEVKPRRVLLIHNTTLTGYQKQDSAAHQLLVMPLQYLGYRVDLLDLDRYELPENSIADRYAAVVAIFARSDRQLEPTLTRFIERTVDEQVPLVFFNRFGLDPNSRVVRARLGLVPPRRALRAPLSIDAIHKQGVGQEIRPLPSTRSIAVRAPEDSVPWLSLRDVRGQWVDGIAVTPWGGFALAPYTYVALAEHGQHRWALDPIRFLRRAIQRDDYLPAPDVTTRDGRRVLLVHVQGDGFESRAEFPGTPWAADVMYREFIRRYQVPHSVSVAQRETGLPVNQRQASEQLRPIAERIFKLRHVRQVPGDTFVVPTSSRAAMTRANASLSAVTPMSVRRDGLLQVYAPHQSENAYTNDWTGPFYGFDRVIETFELTNSPRRLKPINIHYHPYSASKSAAKAALHRVYRYVLSKPVNPVYASDYIATVRDFDAIGIAREIDTASGDQVWRIAGNGALRTLRIPDQAAKRIDWQKSSGIIGRKQGVNGTYVHLGGARARLVISQRTQSAPAHVVATNGRVDQFVRKPNGFEFLFSAHIDGRLTLSHPSQCGVSAGNRRLKPMKRNRRRSSRQAGPIHDYQLKKRDARPRILVSVSC